MVLFSTIDRAIHRNSTAAAAASKVMVAAATEEEESSIWLIVVFYSAITISLVVCCYCHRVCVSFVVCLCVFHFNSVRRTSNFFNG